MLKHLHIQNYAIIEELDLALDKGLSIITGETGAGKSILLGALGLVTGKRADTKVLFDANKKCIVEAEFDIESYQLKDFFEQNDLDYEATLLIRREISSAGKSRAFINDTPTRLDVLQSLSSALIDMHQQFDTLGLQERSFQIKLLDALAGNQNHVALFQEQFKQYQSNQKKLEALIQQEKSSSQENDFIQFQLRELNEVNLISGEDQELGQNLSLMESAEAIKELAQQFDFLISNSDNSIENQLTEISNSIANIDSNEPTLTSLYERIIQSREELIDQAKELSSFSQKIDFDPKEINLLRERQNAINKLLNKHRVTNSEELLQIKSELETRAQSVSDLSGAIKKLQAELQTAESELQIKATKISSKRKKAIGPFEKEVEKKLAQLSMASARIKVKMESEQALNNNGSDEIEFTFASNIGSQFLSIKQVASGGEMSRLSLCIKSIVADAMSLPTMIFDEIDSGISGDVSLKMGKILRDISRDHQVISITHSPPIAAQADQHFFIYKENTKERTYTYVKEIKAKERIFEIAKMMSGGDPPSNKALANAKELIQS